MWEFRSLYIAILAPIQSRQPSHSFGVTDPSTRGDRPIYSVWPSSIKAHLRAPWPDLIFVTLLRRRRFSHLVSVPVDYAQVSDDGRNDDRDNDLDSEPLHEDQARSGADHQMKN
jgi:hypothetical protein